MKPSIFSKDYEKKIRRIRIRRTIIVLVLIAAGILLFTKDNYSKYLKNINLTKIVKTSQAKKDNTKNTKPINKTGGNIVKDVTEEKSYPVQLKDSVVKAIYTKNSKASEFKTIDTSDQNSCSYNISPSGKKMIILDKKTQQMFLLDENGNVNDVTMKNYTSTSGDVFKREDLLNQNPSYVWTEIPTFIDEDNIAFVSSLPWFDERTVKYLWISNLSSNSSKTVFGIEGNIVKFDGTKDGVLKVVSDEKTFYLKSDGTIQNGN